MLANLVIETETIKYRGSEFTVQGMSLDSVAALMADGNRSELELAVEQLEVLFKATDKNDSKAISDGVGALMVQLPGLTAKVIAFAAGEPAEASKVLKLPISVQLEALLAIGRLTFDGETSIKNFMSGLLTLMTSLTKAANITGQIGKNGTQG